MCVLSPFPSVSQSRSLRSLLFSLALFFLLFPSPVSAKGKRMNEDHIFPCLQTCLNKELHHTLFNFALLFRTLYSLHFHFHTTQPASGRPVFYSFRVCAQPTVTVTASLLTFHLRPPQLAFSPSFVPKRILHVVRRLSSLVTPL